MNTNQSTAPLSCSVCSKTYKHKKSLASHIAKATCNPKSVQEQTHSCTICQKVYKYKQSLNSHMQKGTCKPKPFKCHQPDCCKSYSSRKSLNIHLRRFHKVLIDIYAPIDPIYFRDHPEIHQNFDKNNFKIDGLGEQHFPVIEKQAMYRAFIAESIPFITQNGGLQVCFDQAKLTKARRNRVFELIEWQYQAMDQEQENPTFKCAYYSKLNKYTNLVESPEEKPWFGEKHYTKIGLSSKTWNEIAKSNADLLKMMKTGEFDELW